MHHFVSKHAGFLLVLWLFWLLPVKNIGLKTAGKYSKTICTPVYPIKTKIAGVGNEMPVK